MPFIERAGASVFYTKAGAGPPVLLIQGAGVIGEGWRPQVSALAPRFTTVSIDNRGIGRSTMPRGPFSIEAMAEDVLAVADAERFERFHLVGHSMGGLIAQQIALTAGSRVLSLALLCTFLRGRQGAAMSPRLLLIALRSRIGTRTMRRRAFVEMVMPADYLAREDRDALCGSLAELFGRDLADQPPIIMQQVRTMARFDASTRLEDLGDVPTLVVSAEHDLIARPEYGRALAAAIPNARFVLLESAGHAATIQRADAVNSLLLQHLEQATTPFTT